MYFTICRVCFTPVLCIRPLINQKYEEKTCGEGPNLTVMLDDDHWLTSLGRESLVCMYVSACVYVRMYIQCVALYVRMSVWVYTYIHMCVCVCVSQCVGLACCTCTEKQLCCHHFHMIFNQLHVHMQGCVEVSFEKASEYASKFEPFREFYQENDSLDIGSLEEEDHGTLCT